MCEEKAKSMGCTRNTWIQKDYLIWYGATIYHNNIASIVETFCSDQCNFPACMGEAVRPNEKKTTFAMLPNDNGAAQKRAIARAFADGLLPDPANVENRRNQRRLWSSDEDKEGGK